MRILFVITGLGIGGAERQLLDLADRLSTRGHRILIVYLTGPARLLPENPGIKVEPIGVSKNPFGFARGYLHLRRLILDFKPDVIHSHMVHANILARLVRPLAPAPVLICTAHNIDEGGRLREVIYRLTDTLCDLTTQVSQAGLKRYVRVGAVPESRIQYIPNGIDTEIFRPNPEARNRLRESIGLRNSFVWIAVGRFYPQKDYTNLLQAFDTCGAESIQCTSSNCWRWTAETVNGGLAGKLGIDNRVHFLGICREVSDVMNAADAFVLSSRYEGFGLVIAEAMACQLPVVATDSGGPRELLDGGRLGYLVSPGDPNKLADAMLRMMSLPEEERMRMGEAGRSYIESKYSLDRVVEMWEELYRELLSRKGI